MILLFPYEDDVWEPPKFTYTRVDLWDCPLCAEDRTKCLKLQCCGQRICDVCTERWFRQKNTKCPYCRRDPTTSAVTESEKTSRLFS